MSGANLAGEAPQARYDLQILRFLEVEQLSGSDSS